ncbi:hypothetical protein C8R46DRAFT_1040509 [Mycena filopes]|nr:hypothetical protein C8R46DRAFT_1040509 [Mycena filopes]
MKDRRPPPESRKIPQHGDAAAAGGIHKPAQAVVDDGPGQHAKATSVGRTPCSRRVGNRRWDVEAGMLEADAVGDVCVGVWMSKSRSEGMGHGKAAAPTTPAHGLSIVPRTQAPVSCKASRSDPTRHRLQVPDSSSSLRPLDTNASSTRLTSSLHHRQGISPGSGVVVGTPNPRRRRPALASKEMTTEGDTISRGRAVGLRQRHTEADASSWKKAETRGAWKRCKDGRDGPQNILLADAVVIEEKMASPRRGGVEARVGNAEADAPPEQGIWIILGLDLNGLRVQEFEKYGIRSVAINSAFTLHRELTTPPGRHCSRLALAGPLSRFPNPIANVVVRTSKPEFTEVPCFDPKGCAYSRVLVPSTFLDLIALPFQRSVALPIPPPPTLRSSSLHRIHPTLQPTARHAIEAFKWTRPVAFPSSPASPISTPSSTSILTSAVEATMRPQLDVPTRTTPAPHADAERRANSSQHPRARRRRPFVANLLLSLHARSDFARIQGRSQALGQRAPFTLPHRPASRLFSHTSGESQGSPAAIELRPPPSGAPRSDIVEVLAGQSAITRLNSNQDDVSALTRPGADFNPAPGSTKAAQVSRFVRGEFHVRCIWARASRLAGMFHFGMEVDIDPCCSVFGQAVAFGRELGGVVFIGEKSEPVGDII